MMRHLFAYVLIFVAVMAQAQIVPGYQGRKTFVTYQLNASPAFNGNTYTDELPINFTHTLFVERVMGKKFSMSFNYSFAASQNSFFFYRNVTDQSTGQSKDYTFNSRMNVYGHYYTGSFVFYGKRALAPFGKYFKLSLGYCAMYANFTQKQLRSNETNSDGHQIILNSNVGYYKTGSFAFGLSFGMNRIYWKRFIVNRGVSLMVPMKQGNYTTSNRSMNGVTSVMFDRLAHRDIATFYLGMGYLF